MATISYIRTSKDTSLLFLGIIEEGESRRYTISESLYDSLGRPVAHSEINDADFSAVKHTDALYRAEKKALSLLAYADNNERTLKAKLQRAGFSSSVSGEICEKMVSLGYINESVQLERLILSEANLKLRGPVKIAAALAAKGYSSRDIREVLYRLTESGEIDFDENKQRLIEKRLPEDTTEDEVKALLYRNGYKI